MNPALSITKVANTQSTVKAHNDAELKQDTMDGLNSQENKLYILYVSICPLLKSILIIETLSPRI